jgi:CRP/FNR family cyclic AMP-dependent transcriptional regulator
MVISDTRLTTNNLRPGERPDLKSPPFDMTFLSHLTRLISELKTFRIKERVFTQGETAKKVMYVQEGVVKISVVNAIGKVAVLAILGCGDFLGEECLAGEPAYSATAIAITPVTVITIGRNEMVQVLRSEPDFSERFINYTLARKSRIEGDLVDQLFNSSEKRLARTLLLLARIRSDGVSCGEVPKITQEILAEIIGTTRSRVNLFLKRFRRMGFIQYGREIRVNDSLRTYVLESS